MITLRKTKLVRVYVDDVEVLKRMNKRSMADNINTLIHGRTEELREVARDYMETELKPYIDMKLNR